MKRNNKILVLPLLLTVSSLFYSCGTDTTTVTDSPVTTAIPFVTEAVTTTQKVDTTIHLKNAYKMLCDASGTMNSISSVIQSAWHFGIFDDNAHTVGRLALKTGLSKNKLQEVVPDDYYLKEFSGCVVACISAMDEQYSTVKSKIENAKKEIQAATSDLNRYADMKNFYSSSLSYFEWLQKPDGNFSQATQTITDYETKLKEFKNDMEFDFG